MSSRRVKDLAELTDISGVGAGLRYLLCARNAVRRFVLFMWWALGLFHIPPHGSHVSGQARGRPVCRVRVWLLVWDFQQVPSPSWGLRVFGRSFRLNRSHQTHCLRGMGRFIENGSPVLSCGLQYAGSKEQWPQIGGVEATGIPVGHLMA